MKNMSTYLETKSTETSVVSIKNDFLEHVQKNDLAAQIIIDEMILYI